MNRLALFSVFSLILIGPLGLTSCAELDEPLDEVAGAPVESSHTGDFPADRAGESEPSDETSPEVTGAEAIDTTYPTEADGPGCSADYPIYEPDTDNEYEIAPDPSHCQTIEPGYHAVNYEDAEDTLEGRSLETFCICLEEGDTLQLHGNDGDMIIYLFGVDGLEMASTRYQERPGDDGMEPDVLGPILVPESGMYQIGVASWDEDSFWEEPELTVSVD